MVAPRGAEFYGEAGGVEGNVAGDRWSPLQKVIIFSPGFVFAEAMTIRAGYGKLFSLVRDTVCLPDVFSRDAKIPLLLYISAPATANFYL